MNAERQRLVALTDRFIDAFNSSDLDTAMSFFADDAVYDEFNGTQYAGKAAIREAFEPQFSGAFGDMKFIDEDMFVDADMGKVMVSWRCTLRIKGQLTSWRGLDLLHFQGDALVRKITYAKAKAPRFED